MVEGLRQVRRRKEQVPISVCLFGLLRLLCVLPS